MKTRVTPNHLVDAIRYFNDNQAETVREMGFESLLSMKFDLLTCKLGHHIVDNLDDHKLIIRTKYGEIELTRVLVHQLLGIPLGGKDLNEIPEENENHPLVETFKKQFQGKDISKKSIVEKIKESGDDGIIFKLNFLTLFVNSLCKTYPTGYCITKVVNKFVDFEDIANVDWCGYVLNCVRYSKKNWIRRSTKHYYPGPISMLIVSLYEFDIIHFNVILKFYFNLIFNVLFLKLAYVHCIQEVNDNIPRNVPAISFWTYKMIKDIESTEISTLGFGNLILEDSNEEENVVKEVKHKKSYQVCTSILFIIFYN